jgi:hypothetical protein
MAMPVRKVEARDGRDYSLVRTLSMVVKRSTRSYGLLTKSSAPNFFDSIAFFKSANPVSMMTFVAG